MDPIIIRSLNVGAVRSELDAHQRTFESAVRRTPQTAAQFLDERGFAGDASFHPCHHTPNMDVHVFSLDRYAHYESLAGRAFPVPTFGENLSISGGIETEVCIGDRFEVGGALVELSQPTERCPTPGRSIGVRELRTWIYASLYTGYYLRVIRPGWVAAGDALLLRERPHPAWSVDRVNRAVFEYPDDATLYEEVLGLAALSSDWKARMRVLRGRRLTAERRAVGSPR